MKKLAVWVLLLGGAVLLFAADTPDIYHNGQKVERVVVVDSSDNVIDSFGGGGSSTALPTRGSPINRSGSITTGGTSQQLAAVKADRVHFEFQNISDEDQYINFDAAAVADSNSFKIVPGGSYNNPPQFCPNGTITVIGATTGKKFVAKEF